MTVKVIRPLVPGDGVIAYTRKKDQAFDLPPRSNFLARFLPKERVAYFKIRFASDEKSIEIGERVDGEIW
jgi:hypothetical protein